MAVQIDGWSVSPRYRKCKKSDCEVCANGKGHGPYYIGTKRENGKTISRYFGTIPPNQDDVHTTYTSDVQSDVYTMNEEQAVQIEALLQESEQLKAELDQLRPLPAQIKTLKQQNGQLKANLDQLRPLAEQVLADYEKQAEQMKAQLRQIEDLNSEIGRLRAVQTNKQTATTNSPKPAVHEHYQASNDIGQVLSESIKNIETRLRQSQSNRSPFQR